MRAWVLADPLRAVLTVIAVITAFSGAVQVVAPGFVLGALGAESTPTSQHLFATVGMFMVVVGGLLTHTLLSRSQSADVLLWSAVQKFGAFVAVLLGVLNQVFASLALGVAFFDLATAVLLGIAWRRVRRASPAPVGASR
jgi:hypothetical protein